LAALISGLRHDHRFRFLVAGKAFVQNSKLSHIMQTKNRRNNLHSLLTLYLNKTIRKKQRLSAKKLNTNENQQAQNKLGSKRALNLLRAKDVNIFLKQNY